MRLQNWQAPAKLIKHLLCIRQWTARTCFKPMTFGGIYQVKQKQKFESKKLAINSGLTNMQRHPDSSLMQHMRPAQNDLGLFV